MESHVEENQYSTNDDTMMYEMKILPSNQEQEHQVPPQHSKKYTEDKWPLRIVICLLAIILLLLVASVAMSGFIISQSSAECSPAATGAANDGLTATNNNQMCQCNESIIRFAQEIHKRIDDIDVINNTKALMQKSIEQLALLDELLEAAIFTNDVTNSTKALVQGSIEQLAFLVGITEEINTKVNSTDELLEAAVLANNVANSTKALVQGSIEQLALLVGMTEKIKTKVNNTDELLEAIVLIYNVTNSTKALVQGSMEQLALLVDIAHETNTKVNNTDQLHQATILTNNISNSTKALVQGSIEQLALLVGIAHEINTKVNNTYTNDLLYRITNVTQNTNALAQDNMESLIKVNNSFHGIDARIGNSAQVLSLIQTSLNNNTNLLETLATSNSQSHTSIVNTLSNIQDTSTSTAGVVDDTFLVMIHLLLAHNSSFGSAMSCKQIKNLLPTSPSGYYILVSASGSTYTAYCNMEELCGSGGGWTRIAYLDMNDSTVNCPSGFRLYQSEGVRACGRPVTSSGSCVSVQFPSNGISYSQVCGRVTGYQYASPDAVYNHGTNHSNLNADYVDGVSITRGSPRQHVWTLMAGLNGAQYPTYTCPCADDSTQQAQSFVGDHYYCETALVSGTYQQQLYTSDPLWDGQDCGSEETACCNVPGIPWFHRDYGNTTTTDYIELRVCGDEGTDNEDVPVSYYEIYAQ
uniref:Fibrinogen C-terminal domain-containing protein n=1 Tax=Amphimedon queenslandica TaxID=400682 RepID=A0A1X7U6B6_AMPQE